MEVALGECTLRLTSYGVLQPGSALGGCHTLESLRVCPKKILKESQLSLETKLWLEQLKRLLPLLSLGPFLDFPPSKHLIKGASLYP